MARLATRAFLVALLSSACGARTPIPATPVREASPTELDGVRAALSGVDGEVLAARVAGDHMVAVVLHRGDVALPPVRGRVCAGPLPPLADRETRPAAGERPALALARIAIGGTPRVEQLITLETDVMETEVCALDVRDLDGDGRLEVHVVYTRLSNYTPVARRILDVETFAVELSDETGRDFWFAGATRTWTFLAESGGGTGARVEIEGAPPMPEDVVPGEVPTEHETFEFEDPIPGTTELRHDPASDCWRTADGSIAESQHEPDRAPRWTSRRLSVLVEGTLCPWSTR